MKNILFVRSVSDNSLVCQERLLGAYNGARKYGYHIITAVLSENGTRNTRILQDLVDLWHPIGLVVEYPSSALARQFQHFGIPMVHLDRLPGSTVTYSTVYHDADATGRAALEELLALNLPAYGYVPHYRKTDWNRERANVFSQMLSERGKLAKVMKLPSHSNGDAIVHARALRRFLADMPKPCGIFAANDHIASAVVDTCDALGLLIPNEVAVIGVDNNVAVCENSPVTISSVIPNFRDAGYKSIQLLDGLIQGLIKPGESVKFGIKGVARRQTTRQIKRQDHEVMKALAMIHSGACGRMTASAVLGCFTCSRRSAEMRFRQATGNTIVEEIQNERFLHAQELLRTTNATTTAIANMCGYSRDVFLQRMFRKKTGASMSAFRRASQPSRQS